TDPRTAGSGRRRALPDAPDRPAARLAGRTAEPDRPRPRVLRRGGRHARHTRRRTVLPGAAQPVLWPAASSPRSTWPGHTSPPDPAASNTPPHPALGKPPPAGTTRWHHPPVLPVPPDSLRPADQPEPSKPGAPRHNERAHAPNRNQAATGRMRGAVP